MRAGLDRTATIAIHFVALVLAVFWTLCVFDWLVRDSTAVSEWPIWLFSLVATLPIVATSVYSFLAWRHRIMTIVLGMVDAAMVVTLAMTIALLNRALKGCQQGTIGEGTLHGKRVSFAFCSAPLHEAEEWVEIYDPLEHARLSRVGTSDLRRLGVLQARKADPVHSAKLPTFASRPVSITIDRGNMIEVSFEDKHTSRVRICEDGDEFFGCDGDR